MAKPISQYIFGQVDVMKTEMYNYPKVSENQFEIFSWQIFQESNAITGDIWRALGETLQHSNQCSLWTIENNHHSWIEAWCPAAGDKEGFANKY